jgi:hypothetical protein
MKGITQPRLPLWMTAKKEVNVLCDFEENAMVGLPYIIRPFLIRLLGVPYLMIIHLFLADALKQTFLELNKIGGRHITNQAFFSLFDETLRSLLCRDDIGRCIRCMSNAV